MSVLENNKIDGIGQNQKNKELILLITDHLNWTDEYRHLLILQEKINAYIAYIESKQYSDIYPNFVFDRYIIEIHFRFSITDKCVEFIQTTNKQLKEYNMQIITEVK